MRAIVLIALGGLALVGCKSEKSTPKNVPTNELERVLVANGSPDYRRLTTLLLWKQRKVEVFDYQTEIAQITPDAKLDPWATKVELEKRLTALNGGQPLLYNRDHVSLAGPLKHGRLQCFSGTMLNLVVQRQKTQADFDRLNAVMIFTPGHILPGFVLREGEKFRLVGAETTVIGRGRTDFGFTQDLKGAIRVVDAESFLKMYLFQAQIKDVPAMVQILLRQTADRYGIPLAQTEASIAKTDLTIAADAPLNRTAFSFGTEVDVPPPGDIVRAERDEVTPHGLTEASAVGGGASAINMMVRPERRSPPLALLASQFKPNPDCDLERVAATKLRENLKRMDRAILAVETATDGDYAAALERVELVHVTCEKRESDARTQDCRLFTGNQDENWRLELGVRNSMVTEIQAHREEPMRGKVYNTFSFWRDSSHFGVNMLATPDLAWSLGEDGSRFVNSQTGEALPGFCTAGTPNLPETIRKFRSLKPTEP